MKIRVVLLSAFLLLSSAAFAADVTGNWQITISGTNPDGTVTKDTGIASLKQNGDQVTGTLGPDASRQNPIEGTIKDGKVVLKVMPRPDRTMTFELTISGDKLVGKITRTGDDRIGAVEFVKAPAK
jgi:hypothetical protein